jgi:type 1 glutamine amidotransferase
VLGCGYHGHGPNGLGTDVTAAVGQAMMDRGGRLHPHPILAGVKPSEWHSPGSLYLVDQLDPKATVLATGRSLDLAAPVAWTRSYKGGRVFFCSLGHRGDFDQPAFRHMLINAVHWAMDRPVPKLAPE